MARLTRIFKGPYYKYKYHPTVWKVKRLLHYHFGKRKFDTQIGDFVTLVDDHHRIESECQSLYKEVTFMSREIAAQACEKGRYEPYSRMVFTIQEGRPGHPDPLNQYTTVAWKLRVLVHTKKTWKIYVTSLIRKQIK